MDRKFFYPGQVPLSAQFLAEQQNIMVGLGYLAQAVFGTNALVSGLACTPMVPASLTVQVGPGQIYQIEPLDPLGYGSLFADITNVVKQGINRGSQGFTLVPPTVAGQAVNYLIQVAIDEEDTDAIALPYVNSANPAVPFTGPNNNGTTQPTTRKLTVAVSAKPGVAAAAGTQTTPAPDVGYVGLYSITVPYGATTLDASSITQLDTAPFLFKTLPDIPAWVQSGSYLWGDDTGTANAITVNNLSLKPVAYTKGMMIAVKKSATANTGNVTVNLMGMGGVMLGAVALLDISGAQIASGNLPGNITFFAIYNGTSFIWLNGAITNTTVSSFTGSSGEGITVQGTAPFAISLNYPGLSSGTPSDLDLLCFYDHEGGHHMVITWSALLSIITTSIPQQAVPSATLWVRTDGNDATGDGSANIAAKAFATVQGALNYASTHFAFVAALTIRLGVVGTYDVATSAIVPSTVGSLVIQCDAANQSGYVIRGPATSDNGVINAIGISVKVIGLTVVNTGTNSHALHASINGSIITQNVTTSFTNPGGTTGSHYANSQNGSVAIGTGCIIASGAYRAFFGYGGSIALNDNLTVSGNPTFTSAFIDVEVGGVFSRTEGIPTISGSAVGKRYSAVMNGIIDTRGGGANYFPGTIAGSSTGGVYA